MRLDASEIDVSSMDGLRQKTPDELKADLKTLRDGEGGLMIQDSTLERLLRDRYVAADSTVSPGTEATLQLTVWRLPAPRNERRVRTERR